MQYLENAEEMMAKEEQSSFAQQQVSNAKAFASNLITDNPVANKLKEAYF